MNEVNDKIIRESDMPDDGPILEFREVSKRFKSPDGHSVLAIDRFSLTVGEGEFLTIVGPSGCGKSTLLNLIVGLEPTTSGQILERGRPAWRNRLRFGYVTQEDNLFPWRTLRANVEFPLELRGYAAAERRRITEGLLERVGLQGFEDRYPHQLSGGMRQRGNIVRALSFSPEIILMDEPFGPLDAQTRLILQKQLLDIWQQERRTVVFITHDLQEAIGLGDRVVVMTARPGCIKDVHDVDLPRPRDIFHLHENTRFRELLSRLWDQLAQEVEAATAQPAA